MPRAEAAGGSREGLARALFHAYKRVLSPLLHSGAVSECKYLPSCSEYAYVAVVRHGWLRGGLLALRWLSRCHPFARGGADPVP